MRKRVPFNYRIEPSLKDSISSLSRKLTGTLDRNVTITELLEEAIYDLLEKYKKKEKPE